jgi:hypothetical protein
LIVGNAPGRTYVVYRLGQGGWFSEIEGGKTGIVVVPKMVKNTKEAYFKKLEAEIPEKLRIPIGER